MKKPLFTLLFSAAWAALAAAPATDSLPTDAGRPMTLDECMSYAVEHSTSVRQQQHTNENYRQDYIGAIADLVPSLGVSSGISTNFGRAIDPETNGYTTTSTFSNSYSVSGNFPLFAGWSGINTIRATKVMRLLGVEELQQARDQVAIATMKAYIDAVYYAACVRLARDQRATSEANLGMVRKQHELGLKSAADVAELEAQYASDDYALTQQENNLELARIRLAEQMNYPSDRTLEIDTEVAIDALPEAVSAYADVLAHALDHSPEAVTAEYNERYSKLQLSIARGRQLPSIYIGGGFSSSFYTDMDNWNRYASFSQQFRDNRGYYFSASISIPIFGGLARRTAINRARNNYRIAQLKREQALRALESEVAQAYQQMVGAGKAFVQATKKSAAVELAYKAVSGKYDRGMVSTIELQTAANELLQARAEKVRSRLEYIVNTRMVEYYNGRPLIR